MNFYEPYFRYKGDNYVVLIRKLHLFKNWSLNAIMDSCYNRNPAG